MTTNLFSILVCPDDKGDLKVIAKGKRRHFYCARCHRKYNFEGDIPNFLLDELQLPQKGKWRPGYRGWRPSFMTRLIALSFRKDNGRLRERTGGGIKRLVLDVGCGDDYNGDVSVDIYVPRPLPPNFVLASADKLPFKNNAFDIVRSAYVIEHNLYPVEFIKEQLRVSKRLVKIYTDNSDWLGIFCYRLLNVGSIFHDEHYFKWSKEYFKNLLNRLGLEGQVTVFNSSPALLVILLSLLGKLPRIGTLFYRDLAVVITKK